MNTENKKTFYLYYYDDIDPERVRYIMQVCTNIINAEEYKNVDELYFLFSSNGGSVDAGITLYNFLKSLPKKITMHNIGSIDSIANVVFMAGEQRLAVPHATFLYHGVNWGLSKDINLNLNQIGEIKDRLFKNQEQISGIIQQNCKMTQKEIDNLFLEGQTINTQFAIDKAIIEKIINPDITKDSLIFTFNFQTKG